ncbi:MAG TPA: ribosome biogenesis GTPase Der [Verrucomicrobiae bacterium]|nr:ribosome biogenesis GTPase Der [Verrucomicrobiae bacterium]
MKIPLVALVGLPNAGKSTLFNKILEIRKALTHPVAGTTRDRHYGLTTWNGLGFYLIDTAGISNKTNSPLEKNIQKQTAIAQDEADLILLIVDGKTNISNEDLVVANKLQKTKKPVLLAVNKIDSRSTKTETAASQFRTLGLGAPILISATSGAGVGDLLDAIVDELKKIYTEPAPEESDRLKLAFIGKPNVGKSSLINALLKQDRLLVDSKAGTTRSTVDIPFEYGDKKYLLLDTAGVKKKWKQDVDIEAAAAMQSLRTIPQVDVALFVIDASTDMTFQDQAIAQEILEQNKTIVLVINKVDLLSEEEKNSLLDRLPDYLPQLWWAPVVFTSSKVGHGLVKMLELAQSAFAAGNRQIDNDLLDQFLDDVLRKHTPEKMQDERDPKIYNLKQIATNPPVFKLTVNLPSAIAPGWKKFFEKQFRLKFGFEGTPVVFKYIRKN